MHEGRVAGVAHSAGGGGRDVDFVNGVEGLVYLRRVMGKMEWLGDFWKMMVEVKSGGRGMFKALFVEMGCKC